MKVYIKGDVAWSPEIYSAQNDVLLKDVVGIDVSWTQGAWPEGKLFYADGREEVVDVVQAPKDYTAAFSVEVSQGRDIMGNGTIIEATLKRPGQQDYHVRQMADDQLVFGSSIDLIAEISQDAVRQVLEPLVKDLAIKRQQNTGGVVSAAKPLGSFKYPTKPNPFKLAVEPCRDVLKSKCSECGGSGEIQLFSSVEPCGKCVS